MVTLLVKSVDPRQWLTGQAVSCNMESRVDICLDRLDTKPILLWISFITSAFSWFKKGLHAYGTGIEWLSLKMSDKVGEGLEVSWELVIGDFGFSTHWCWNEFRKIVLVATLLDHGPFLKREIYSTFGGSGWNPWYDGQRLPTNFWLVEFPFEWQYWAMLPIQK